MERLYIQIVGGRPVNHPAFENNLIEAFGSVPDDWVLFTRVPKPLVGLYQVIDPPEPTYDFVDGSWCDYWTVRGMTPEEKALIQRPVRDAWANRPYASNFSAWEFDEETCSYKPPVPRPEGHAAWDGATNTWKERQARPDDGKAYKWDIPSWSWVEVI
jgi:hypothetical protein